MDCVLEKGMACVLINAWTQNYPYPSQQQSLLHPTARQQRPPSAKCLYWFRTGSLIATKTDKVSKKKSVSTLRTQTKGIWYHLERNIFFHNKNKVLELGRRQCQHPLSRSHFRANPSELEINIPYKITHPEIIRISRRHCSALKIQIRNLRDFFCEPTPWRVKEPITFFLPFEKQTKRGEGDHGQGRLEP